MNYQNLGVQVLEMIGSL